MLVLLPWLLCACVVSAWPTTSSLLLTSFPPKPLQALTQTRLKWQDDLMCRVDDVANNTDCNVDPSYITWRWPITGNWLGLCPCLWFFIHLLEASIAVSATLKCGLFCNTLTYIKKNREKKIGAHCVFKYHLARLHVHHTKLCTYRLQLALTDTTFALWWASWAKTGNLQLKWLRRDFEFFAFF